MLKTPMLLLAFALLSSACATSVPLAVACPAPPPVPEVLRQPAKTPDLLERYEGLTREFSDSLRKAPGP